MANPFGDMPSAYDEGDDSAAWFYESESSPSKQDEKPKKDDDAAADANNPFATAECWEVPAWAREEPFTTTGERKNKNKNKNSRKEEEREVAAAATGRKSRNTRSAREWSNEAGGKSTQSMRVTLLSKATRE